MTVSEIIARACLQQRCGVAAVAVVVKVITNLRLVNFYFFRCFIVEAAFFICGLAVCHDAGIKFPLCVKIVVVDGVVAVVNADVVIGVVAVVISNVVIGVVHDIVAAVNAVVFIINVHCCCRQYSHHCCWLSLVLLLDLLMLLSSSLLLLMWCRSCESLAQN